MSNAIFFNRGTIPYRNLYSTVKVHNRDTSYIQISHHAVKLFSVAIHSSLLCLIKV